jgi:hypothetical protein
MGREWGEIRRWNHGHAVRVYMVVLEEKGAGTLLERRKPEEVHLISRGVLRDSFLIEGPPLMMTMIFS